MKGPKTIIVQVVEQCLNNCSGCYLGKKDRKPDINAQIRTLRRVVRPEDEIYVSINGLAWNVSNDPLVETFIEGLKLIWETSEKVSKAYISTPKDAMGMIYYLWNGFVPSRWTPDIWYLSANRKFSIVDTVAVCREMRFLTVRPMKIGLIADVDIISQNPDIFIDNLLRDVDTVHITAWKTGPISATTLQNFDKVTKAVVKKFSSIESEYITIDRCLLYLSGMESAKPCDGYIHINCDGKTVKCPYMAATGNLDYCPFDNRKLLK